MGAMRLGHEETSFCLVCRDPVSLDDETVRLSGGGHVHSECATYRMRQRDGRRQRQRRTPQAALTGD
jgi:hypothetical protein